MDFNNKFWKWFVAIATVLGFITGGMALYDHFTKEEYTIEQKVDPETMERLKKLHPGESITVEKGKPEENNHE